MKKIFFVIATGMLIAGCGKVIEYSTNFGSATFINASTSLTGVIPRPGAIVFIDTVPKITSLIPYRGASGYLGIEPGARRVELRTNTTPSTSILLLSDKENFEINKANTYVLYDTISASNSLKVLKLDDDLVIPSPGNIKVRFLHLANNAPAVDVTLLRTSVTPNDSVTINNQSYVANNSGISALSAFITIPQGTYTARVKLAGTQTVALSASLAAFNSTNGIFTVFAAGTTGGQALTANVFRHN
jgi:hypothetical protein